jgi:hypothetical protein
MDTTQKYTVLYISVLYSSILRLLLFPFFIFSLSPFYYSPSTLIFLIRKCVPSEYEWNKVSVYHRFWFTVSSVGYIASSAKCCYYI